MKPIAVGTNIQPLKIVGSNKFGRFPKMSSEETINMIITDGWLFPFAGYKNVLTLNPKGEGRGIYASEKLGKMFAVIDNRVYLFDKGLSALVIGTLLSFRGDVFIADNNTDKVAFSDSQNLYIYDASVNPPTFTMENADELGFTPGYLTYQDTRFISPNLNTSFWSLSTDGYVPFEGSNWPGTSQYVGEVSTKPSNAVACQRMPGGGNLLLVFGTNVAEFWTDVGSQLFPYQRSQSHNIDYGCINPATIAANQNMVCWVGINEQSGPAIMYTMGADVKKISTDGIDYRLSLLDEPSNCYGFMLRLAGHVLYVVTWPGEKDNISYVYDFNTDSFFTLCDENRNAFIVKRVAFFNDKYYFVSLIDGNIYELSASLFTFDYGNGNVKEIPFIRIPPNIQMADQSRFVASVAGFTIQQGSFQNVDTDTDNLPRIDLSISKDGSTNYGSNASRPMRVQGKRANRLLWRNFGAANDLTFQFRFHGLGPFVCTDGIVGVHQ